MTTRSTCRRKKTLIHLPFSHVLPISIFFEVEFKTQSFALSKTSWSMRRKTLVLMGIISSRLRKSTASSVTNSRNTLCCSLRSRIMFFLLCGSLVQSTFSRLRIIHPIRRLGQNVLCRYARPAHTFSHSLSPRKSSTLDSQVSSYLPLLVLNILFLVAGEASGNGEARPTY